MTGEGLEGASLYIGRHTSAGRSCHDSCLFVQEGWKMADESKALPESGGDASRREVLIAAGAVAATALLGGTARSAEEKFNPNKLTFAEGIARIKKATEGSGFGKGKIVTSRDMGADKVMEALRVTN